MTSQTGKQKIAIHKLPNITLSKGNQAVNFGQLIEYSMKNIFLEKSYTECVNPLFPDPFLKYQN